MAKMVGDRYVALLNKKHGLIEAKTDDPAKKKKFWALSLEDLEGGKG